MTRSVDICSTLQVFVIHHFSRVLVERSSHDWSPRSGALMLSLELDNTSLSGRLLVVNDHEEDEEEEDISNIFSNIR